MNKLDIITNEYCKTTEKIECKIRQPKWDNRNIEIKRCRFCGGIPTIDLSQDNIIHDCGCCHVIEIGNIIVDGFRPIDIDMFIEKWNARNEKFNPFLEYKNNEK